VCAEARDWPTEKCEACVRCNKPYGPNILHGVLDPISQRAPDTLPGQPIRLRKRRHSECILPSSSQGDSQAVSTTVHSTSFLQPTKPSDAVRPSCDLEMNLPNSPPGENTARYRSMPSEGGIFEWTQFGNDVRKRLVLNRYCNYPAF
jgi:hypothetical protein